MIKEYIMCNKKQVCPTCEGISEVPSGAPVECSYDDGHKKYCPTCIGTGKRPKIMPFVGENGMYHCVCGATHKRGPINGGFVYRCLKCGEFYNVSYKEPVKV